MIEESQLQLAPLELRALTSHEWDAAEQEPELTVVFQTHRTTDKNGRPCSELKYGYLIEGQLNAPMSQPQADFTAALGRHVASLIQDEHGATESGLERRAAMLARRYRSELTASMTAFVGLSRFVSDRVGPDVAAGWLGMKKARLIHLLKSHQGAVPKIAEKVA